MNKLIKNIAVGILLFSTIGLQSCNEWLDINTNELAATTTDPGYLFNYAAINYSSKRVGGDQWIPIIYASQVASDADNWFWGDDMYNISTYATGNGWVGTYASAGFNLMEAMKIAKEENNNNAIAQCKVLFAITIWESTMIYGDIPYSQAWNIVDYQTPEFDSQKDVLYAVVNLCDEALGLFDPSNDMKISKYDIYYTGDINKWIKLANTIKLRTYLYLANKEDVGNAIAAIVNENKLFSSNADDFIFPFFETPGNQNPNYQLVQQYPDYYDYCFFANPTILDPMLSVNDPRLPKYFRPNADGEYIAIEASAKGSVVNDDAVSENPSLCTEAVFNINLLRADYPDIICSYSETELYLAEIYVRGLGVTKDLSKADEAYKKGIKASCVFNGVKDKDASEFVENIPLLSSMANENEMLSAIASQQRISMMMRPLEAWSNQRRAGYPVLSVPESIKKDYPDVMHRWIYPPREGNVNPNLPEIEGIWTKMWFEK